MNVRFMQPGARAPMGLSRHIHGYRLRFPVFAWNRRRYDICTDRFVYGLWRLEVNIRTELAGFAVHWGWTLIKEKDNG